MAADGAATSASPAPSQPDDPLVVYVLLRKDLEWPVGALINQACHATAAVVWEARADADAIRYLGEEEGQMVKSTLGAKNEAQLLKVAKRLEAAGVPFKLWVEQPEDIPVCLATWPRRRSTLKKPFKGVSRF